MREVYEKGKYFMETLNIVVTVISIIVTVIGIIVTIVTTHHNVKNGRNKRSNRTSDQD